MEVVNMSTNVLASTKEEFEQLISQEKVVIADFFATWCGPCRMLAPIIEQLNQEIGDKVKIVKIDVDQEKDLAMKYEIQSVPTVIIFKDGEVHARETGLQSIKTYKEIINKIL